MNKSLDYRKLNAACRLLLDLGSDQEFEQYLRILRDSKVHDIGRYRQLWQVASEGKSQHIVRILAVLLDDERLASPKDSVRYCDFAGALLRKFSEEKFGFE